MEWRLIPLLVHLVNGVVGVVASVGVGAVVVGDLVGAVVGWGEGVVS